MKKLIEKIKSLKTEYREDVLLEIVEEYNGYLAEDNIDYTLWYDAIDELIEDLKAGDTTLLSIYDETAQIAEKYEELLSESKNPETKTEKQSTLRSIISAPVYLLNVVYVYNHKEFINLEDFVMEGLNNPFSKAIGGEEE